MLSATRRLARRALHGCTHNALCRARLQTAAPETLLGRRLAASAGWASVKGDAQRTFASDLAGWPTPAHPPGTPGTTEMLTDWSKCISARVRLVCVSEKEDLKNIIEEAHRPAPNNFQFKVVGSLHSASDIWVPETDGKCQPGVVVDISKLDRIDEIDHSSQTVWVGAGAKLANVVPALELQGLCIDSLGGIMHQSIAGVVSTGTLPASPIYNMGFAKALRVLRWDQKQQRVVEQVIDCTSDSYMLSLGLVYVITEVQLQLVPKTPYGYDAIERIVTFHEVWRDYAEWNKRYAFWRVNWVTGEGRGLFWAANPAQLPTPDRPYEDWLTNKVLHKAMAILHRHVSPIGPAGTGFFRRSCGTLLDREFWQYLGARMLWCLVVRLVCEQTFHGPFSMIIPRDHNVDQLRVTMAEWFFPAKQVNVVAGVIKKVYESRGNVGCVPFEFEPVKSNKVLLSPAYSFSPDQDIIYKVNFMFAAEHDFKDTQKHLKTLWDMLLDAGVDLRWHWGKLHFADLKMTEKVYSPEVVQRFKEETMPALRNAYYHRCFE